MKLKHVLRLLFGWLVVVSGLAACGSPTAGATHPIVVAERGNLRIQAAYVRPAVKIETGATATPMDHSMPGMDHSTMPEEDNSSVGAAYFVVVNTGPEVDTLLSATSDAATSAELHETVKEGNFAKMEARPQGVSVPANGELSFAPGGYHLMLVGLKQSLTVGMQVQLTLQFAKAGTVQFTVPVRTGP